MEGSQVGEALAGLDDGIVDIQISVRLLGASYHLNELLDGIVDLIAGVLLQEVTSPLDPFRNTMNSGLACDSIENTPWVISAA